MKKFIKENIKIIMLLVINTLIVGSITGVFAYSYAAKDIEYTPRDTSWKVNNVEDAIKSLKNDKGGVSNNYSLEEQVVGTWVNGKPLYQKVINVTAPSSATTWTDVYTVEDAEYLRVLYGELEINDTNVDKIILDHGTTAYMAIKGNKVRMYVASSYVNKNALLVIQYTKTTDSASNS